MAEDGTKSVIAEQRLRRLGLDVKLDKGFEDGSYCVYVEYDDLAHRIGFAAAHQMAEQYCGLLKGKLAGLAGRELGATRDGSETREPGRKHDLEATFLWFDIETGDGCFHDQAVREQFRVASLRAGQAWDQIQARKQAHLRETRQERFRQQLANLLDAPAYGDVEGDIRERLLREVPGLAFPPPTVGR